MTPVEILAFVFSLVILVKLLMIFIYPEFSLKMAKSAAKNKLFTTILYLVLAAIIGYYLFQSFTIVQIAAIMLFTSLLVGITILPYMEHSIKIKEGLRGNIKKSWLAILIWFVFAILVLIAVFS